VSFTTFRAISYVVDVGRGDVEPLGFVDVLLHLAFFPSLVAGPIARVGELVPQFHQRPDPRYVAATEAFILIGLGLFKKVVIASYLGTQLVDPAFGVPGAHSGTELLVAVYGYAVQIYADFSGYTDIAIGCALLLGVRLPENFRAPYGALSVRDFWRRWHMTLSRWLRDYVYIPLGGSRHGERATYRNVMVTMLLGGLWHGADWHFVIWGGLHGTYLVGERVASAWWSARAPRPTFARAPLHNTLTAVARWVVTFNLVCLAWIFFRADTAATALEIVGRIATAPGPTTLVTGLALATIAVALAAQLVPDKRGDRVRARFAALDPAGQVVVLAAGLTLIGVLGPDGVAPFIYFQF
jgi:D-alanyl-lipoteichoic acid acyltransferase DltB (MBOAT superfamily)